MHERGGEGRCYYRRSIEWQWETVWPMWPLCLMDHLSLSLWSCSLSRAAKPANSLTWGSKHWMAAGIKISVSPFKSWFFLQSNHESKLSAWTLFEPFRQFLCRIVTKTDNDIKTLPFTHPRLVPNVLSYWRWDVGHNVDLFLYTINAWDIELQKWHHKIPALFKIRVTG